MRTITSLAACLLIGITLNAQDSSGKLPAWATWKGKSISLAHPMEWKADDSGAGNMLVIFRSPMDSGDVFQENVNLMIQDIAAMDLPTYVAATEEQIRTQLPNGVVVNSSTQRGTSGEYHQFEYTGELNGLLLHWKQVVRLRGAQVYLLTFTAHADAWDEDLYLSEAMLDSFKWVEQ